MLHILVHILWRNELIKDQITRKAGSVSVLYATQMWLTN